MLTRVTEQYYYYFMTAAGYKIWWKKYLTTLQITQFVIDLFTVYFASKTRRLSPSTAFQCLC